MTDVLIAAGFFAAWLLLGGLVVLFVSRARKRLNGHKPMPAPDRPGGDDQFEQWLGDGDRRSI